MKIIYKKVVTIMGYCARWLFILSVPILLFSVSVGWAVNESRLYQYGFNKYQISQVTGMDKAELHRISGVLIDYFNCNEEAVTIEVSKNNRQFALFSQRERIHLRDVKSLIQLDYHVLGGALAYSVIFSTWILLRRRKYAGPSLAKAVIWGSIIAVAMVVALGVSTLFSFDQLFLQFHLFSFSNEYWILDPSRDYLIMLFPAGFFYDAALFICGVVTVGALLLGGLSGAFLALTRHSNRK